MKAHHALGAFSLAGMLALVYGALALCAAWGWPAVGQILALLIGATWVWSIMDADKSMEAENLAEKRQMGHMLKSIAEHEHATHEEAKQVKPWQQ